MKPYVVKLGDWWAWGCWACGSLRYGWRSGHTWQWAVQRALEHWADWHAFDAADITMEIPAHG